jgi:hypothetical protein
MKWDVRVTSFFDYVSIKVVPNILSDTTCTMLLVVRLIIACGDCWLINMRLSYVNFGGYICWIGKYGVVST